MADQDFRWGVLGCGVIANEMAQALQADGRHLAGVANRTLPKAEAFAERYGVETVYPSFEAMISDPAIDAVYITTPHNTHINYLRQALAAKKHVLCEKAITLNSEELDEALALAEENGVVLMDAMTIFHMPLYRELLRRLDTGEFGEVNVVTLNFGSYKDYDERNRFFNVNLAGGALLDIGVYALSLARLFVPGELVQLKSIMGQAPTGVDERSAIIAQSEEGQLVSATLTLRSKQPKRAMVSCDKCYIEVMEYPRADEAKIVWTETGEVELVQCGERPRALAYEMADLERAVEDPAYGNQLMAWTCDVMDTMTKLRREWRFFYPEEAEIRAALEAEEV
ncbi:Gfo/Idh/MocA family oxidoreductase [Olsenella sp. YH-ols2217]|uniref:Gfo/Idh/MocA family oxidoreductase n=1 Tax=Kribbibacterium absianum TaxID=3044210 RepID=A0ABT6ZLI5_9ACTN|nr:MULTISPECIES: Gfo/Idh/MocA family oxidoreductase [unclassified Olsenella]MDJ1121739.1 Gfo/Idh/MocA family oxidoreductase [Olsenella sp. YH-ols2216]MDJ1129747.1 Gfo/Idh/MocA family oxidoreductase [Olsenella sp. YH-ols2217]